MTEIYEIQVDLIIRLDKHSPDPSVISFNANYGATLKRVDIEGDSILSQLEMIVKIYLEPMKSCLILRTHDCDVGGTENFKDLTLNFVESWN